MFFSQKNPNLDLQNTAPVDKSTSTPPKWHFESVHYIQHLWGFGLDPYTIRGVLEGRWNVGVNSMELTFCLKSFWNSCFVIARKSQLRFTHYTRYIWAFRRDPYTIRVTLSKSSKTLRIVISRSNVTTKPHGIEQKKTSIPWGLGQIPQKYCQKFWKQMKKNFQKSPNWISKTPLLSTNPLRPLQNDTSNPHTIYSTWELLASIWPLYVVLWKVAEMLA